MPDFNHRANSDEEWAALLRPLHLQPAAKPQPFFYARLQARLAASAAPAEALLPGWLRRPAYAAVLAALVLAVSGDGAGTTAAHPGFRSTWPVPPLSR